MAKSCKDRSEFHRSCITNTTFPIINGGVFSKCLQSLGNHSGIWSWAAVDILSYCIFHEKKRCRYLGNHHITGLTSF